jgi:hypothetical protein
MARAKVTCGAPLVRSRHVASRICPWVGERGNQWGLVRNQRSVALSLGLSGDQSPTSRGSPEFGGSFLTIIVTGGFEAGTGFPSPNSGGNVSVTVFL